MESSITQQVRKQLHEGKSSAEVIALGFKPSTVYKVQHQWRRGEDGPEVGSPGPEVEALGTTGSNDPPSEQDPNETDPEEESLELLAAAAEIEGLRIQMSDLEVHAEHLEREAEEADMLRERITTLTSEAQQAEALRGQVRALQTQLHHACHTEAAMRQGAAQFRQQLGAEQEARRMSESESTNQAREIMGLRQECQSQQEILGRAESALNALLAEVETLRPLRVWAGHPCQRCGKPMSGLVDRATAARLLEDFSHVACLEQRSSGLRSVALTLAGIYGVSKLT